MNENDRRVVKTKRLLRNSLAELLCEKKISSITIRELTSRIDISRNTFYSHYEDIYALYEEMEKELFESITKLLSDSSSNDYMTSLNNMADYMQQNASLMRAFLCTTENYHFREKLAKHFEDKFTEIALLEMNATHMEDDWKYLIKYHSSGVVACFSMWIETNFTYPKKKLLKMIMDIDSASDNLYGR